MNLGLASDARSRRCVASFPTGRLREHFNDCEIQSRQDSPVLPGSRKFVVKALRFRRRTDHSSSDSEITPREPAYGDTARRTQNLPAFKRQYDDVSFHCAFSFSRRLAISPALLCVFLSFLFLQPPNHARIHRSWTAYYSCSTLSACALTRLTHTTISNCSSVGTVMESATFFSLLALSWCLVAVVFLHHQLSPARNEPERKSAEKRQPLDDDMGKC